MKIENKHHEAARVLANCGTEIQAAKAAGVADSSVTRWKRSEDFQRLISYYEAPQMKAALESASEQKIQVYETVLIEESELVSKLESMLYRLGDLLCSKLEAMSDEDLEDMPLRLLPQYLKAYSEGLTLLMNVHDRASGYNLISSELSKAIEASTGS